MKRRIRHGGDLQSGVICRRCNAKAVNLAGGEVRCGEIGAVISSAETSEAVKCSAPGTDGRTDRRTPHDETDCSWYFKNLRAGIFHQSLAV